jgi:hypothetical protein
MIAVVRLTKLTKGMQHRVTGRPLIVRWTGYGRKRCGPNLEYYLLAFATTNHIWGWSVSRLRVEPAISRIQVSSITGVANLCVFLGVGNFI